LTKEQRQYKSRERRVFAINGAGKAAWPHGKKKKNLDTDLTPVTKINPKSNIFKCNIQNS
jgi:hypothetical protein